MVENPNPKHEESSASSESVVGDMTRTAQFLQKETRKEETQAEIKRRLSKYDATAYQENVKSIVPHET